MRRVAATMVASRSAAAERVEWPRCARHASAANSSAVETATIRSSVRFASPRSRRLRRPGDAVLDRRRGAGDEQRRAGVQHHDVTRRPAGASQNAAG